MSSVFGSPGEQARAIGELSSFVSRSELVEGLVVGLAVALFGLRALQLVASSEWRREWASALTAAGVVLLASVALILIALVQRIL